MQLEKLKKTLDKHKKGLKYVETKTDIFIIINSRKNTAPFLELLHLFGKSMAALYKQCSMRIDAPKYMLDRNTLFICIVFSLNPCELVFMMTINDFQMDQLMIYSVCKNLQYKRKRMFQDALHFCISSEKSISNLQNNLFLGISFDNPHFCTAMCAYIKAGFLPYEVKHKSKRSYILMKFNGVI